MINYQDQIIENVLHECYSGLLGAQKFQTDQGINLQWNNAGIKTPFYNFVFEFDCKPDLAYEGMQIIRESYAKTHDATTWFLGPSASPSSIKEELAKTCPLPPLQAAGMLLNLNYLSKSYNVDPNTRIIQVNNSQELKIWSDIVGEVFHFDPPEIIFPLVCHMSNNFQFDTHYVFFLAYHNDYPAGASLLFLDRRKPFAGHFRDSVLPHYRGLGIGARMIRARLEYARDLNYHYVAAHCLPSSARIYQSHGFRSYGIYDIFLQDYSQHY